MTESVQRSLFALGYLLQMILVPLNFVVGAINIIPHMLMGTFGAISEIVKKHDKALAERRAELYGGEDD